MKEDLKEIIAKDKEERTKKCVIEVEEVLKKYECKLEPITILKDGAVQTQINIEALD